MDPVIGGLMAPIIGGAANQFFGEMGAQRNEKYARRMADYNQRIGQENARFMHDLSFDMWKKTNYGAQMDEMIKAGLSPGLMYGQGGAGGSLGGGSMSQGTGSAGLMESQQGTQLAALAADINLKDAQAEKAREEAKTEGGTNVRGSAEIQNLFANVKETDAKAKLIGTQNRLTDAQADIVEATSMGEIEKVYAELTKTNEEIEAQRIANKIDGKSADDIIERNRLETLGAALANEKLNAEIGLTKKQAQYLEATVKFKYDELNTKVKMFNAEMKQRRNEYNLDKKKVNIAKIEAETNRFRAEVAEDLGLRQQDYQNRKMAVDGVLSVFGMLSPFGDHQPSSTTTESWTQNYDSKGKPSTATRSGSTVKRN